MPKDAKIALIDGYIDDPAALGVPPYISPMARAIAGAAMDAGCGVEYVTIDMIRDGKRLPTADATVVLSGNTVPGKYIRSMPMSLRELEQISPKIKGWKILGGSASSSELAGRFDFSIRKDVAASLYDGIRGKEVLERYRTLEEWNRWMVLGAGIVTQHQDFPIPLVAEVETYRGCHRHASGGCSYCIEPLKGKPLVRGVDDILEEVRRLKDLGVRYVRIGGQTCIISYDSRDESSIPRPNVSSISNLFEELKGMFEVLHVDNANPAVISNFPDESKAIIGILKECCTPGNVLALGMESADPIVFRENNLNSESDQTLDAIRMINEIGGERGSNGMPHILPGLNMICGLDGETSSTYELNLEFLRKVLNEGLMVRRINIRQVLPLRREFNVKVDAKRFKRFKDSVREEIDHEMLRRVVPKGTILTDVFTEIHDGKTTFGRQIGSYPLLVGIPYKLNLNDFYNIIITEWGFRSVTGIEYPFKINQMPLSAIESLPGVGRKRATRIFLGRPYGGMEDLKKAMDDWSVLESLDGIISFE